MSRSPSPASAEPLKRRWSNPRCPLAVPEADGWFHPRESKIAARSRGRGRIRGGSRRGRDRGTSSTCTRGKIRRDLSHPISIGEPAGSVGDATPAGGEPGDVSTRGRRNYFWDENPTLMLRLLHRAPGWFSVDTLPDYELDNLVFELGFEFKWSHLLH